MTGGTGNYTGSFDYNYYWMLFGIGDIFNIEVRTTALYTPIAIDFTGTRLDIYEGSDNAAARPLGIRLSNIDIPEEIADEIDSWEIFYAKRNNSNISVIGQDVMKEDRIHNFDLVYNQANLRGDWLKPQVLFQRTSIIPLSTHNNYIDNPCYEFPTDDFVSPLMLTAFYYLGEDVLIPIDNTDKATCIYVQPVPDSSYNDVLFDIHIYRKDMYKSFDTQELITTGYSFKVTDSGVQDPQNVFGGDTFISAFGFVDNLPSINQYLIPQESASNIGLRMDDETLTVAKYYFPKHVYTDPTPPSFSFYGYNSDYSALNGLNKVFPRAISYDNCNNDIYIFPYLIPFSIDDANESKTLGWRIFPVNNYYDALPKDKGKIWNILGSNRTLYIQQEYALLIAEVKDKLQGTDVYLGTTDIFDRPPIEVEPDEEGYVGGQSQFAIILCPMGYITVDRQKGKIFAYKHGSKNPLKEISGQGYYKFFLKNIQTSDIDTDNPFIGMGLVCAYDKDFGRLIVTKLDSDGRRFTMSYCPDLDEGNGAWICEHDYYPNYIYSTRDGIFGIDNTNKKIYQHNSETLKGIYYQGVMYNSYVDVIFNDSQELTKYFSNIHWLSTVEGSTGAVVQTETITHIMIYNENQCSGVIDLRIEDNIWFGKDVKNVEKTWNFNKFKDLIKDATLPFIDDNGDLITANINNNKNWFDKNKFISKFVVVRFICDNISQRDVHITQVGTNVRKSDR